MKDLSSNALLSKVIEELSALRQGQVGMRLDLSPECAFAVVAFLQLALRHPSSAGNSSVAYARDFINQVSARFEVSNYSAITEAIRRGDDPSFDNPSFDDENTPRTTPIHPKQRPH